MTNGTNAEPTQASQEQINQTPITFTVTIGELNAIFGVINAGPFQAVMQPVRDDLTAQVAAHQIPNQPTQAEALMVQVPLTLKFGEINSIFSIINSSGFATVMKPVLDSITQQAQLFVNQLNAQQAEQQGQGEQLGPLPLPPINFPTQ